jgi:hypothetical protein
LKNPSWPTKRASHRSRAIVAKAALISELVLAAMEAPLTPLRALEQDSKAAIAEFAKERRPGNTFAHVLRDAGV